MQEKIKHFRIFLIYYGMGEGRSLKKLEAACEGVSLRQLKRYSKEFKWQDRLEYANKIICGKLILTLKQAKQQHLEKTFELLKDFKLQKPLTVNEYIRLANFQLEMLGWISPARKTKQNQDASLVTFADIYYPNFGTKQKKH